MFLHFCKFPLLILEISDKNRVHVHPQEVKPVGLGRTFLPPCGATDSKVS